MSIAVQSIRGGDGRNEIILNALKRRCNPLADIPMFCPPLAGTGGTRLSLPWAAADWLRSLKTVKREDRGGSAAMLVAQWGSRFRLHGWNLLPSGAGCDRMNITKLSWAVG